MLKLALLAYAAIALAAAGAFWFETPSIGCGQIRQLDETGATASGAYYCHVILKPR